jgi:thiamine-phosphate pyrophosphorylase
MLGRLHYIASYTGQDDAARILVLLSLALDAGVPCVQVRAKDCSDRQRYEFAVRAVQACHEVGASCIINDRLDIALASGADGAHVGPLDLPVAEARRLLGPELLLGASARTPAVALEAAEAGADYVGVGPCYLTSTKEDLPAPIGAAGLAAVAEAVRLPVLAIGGVTAAQVPELLEAGSYGVAVVSAIAAASDPAGATRELMTILASAPGAPGVPPLLATAPTKAPLGGGR